jgi:hypothetical protein
MSLNILGWAAIAFGTATLVGMYKKAPDLSSDLNSLVIPFGLAVVALVASFMYQQRLQSNAAFVEDSWPRIQQSVSAGSDALEIEAPGYSRVTSGVDLSRRWKILRPYISSWTPPTR